MCEGGWCGGMVCEGAGVEGWCVSQSPVTAPSE